ncbi:MAG: hypothetical protein IPG97_10015 [Microthrixaceae bacterium]|nr:hypothetical protein [Microthrixaceae bacterium]
MSPRGVRRGRFIPRTDGAAAHQDWLSLCAPTLPFLSVPVLTDAFETGPLHIDRDLRAAAISRWEGGDLDDGAVDDRDRTTWVEWLLTDLLGFDDRVAKTDRFTTAGTEPGTSVTATYAILDDPTQPTTSTARLLVLVLPAGTSPDGRGGDAWSATWTQRMALLLRRTGVELGMVTDGDLIRIVWAKQDISTGHATWRASLFSSERDHLDALWSVFSARQFFAAHPDEQPEALLQRSLAAEAEVTSTLGHQVRRAVELLVTSLDRADRDPETPRFLDGVPPGEVYEAAVTVLMRLVFVLAAEENGLLPLNRTLYADQYAISTLRGQLEDDARLGRERLEQRSSGWHRILAVTRAVHGGLTHEQIAITAYGGNLFDPDRYPFLEGRPDDGTNWWQDPGRPPLVDDLTILEIMRALQVLQLSQTDTRTLSYKNLEVEQIGHVYEGLLDHSAVSSGDATFLGIVGKQGEEPELELRILEEKLLAGRDKLATYLAGKDVTGHTKNKIKTLLEADQAAGRLAALRAACGGDQTLADRVAPFLGVLRDDLRGYPLVFPPGSIYVTQTGSRRDSGTAYTTKHLADEVVEHALAPLCYSPGPQDTRDTDQWQPRSSQEILDLKVCDMAVGSGAILVAACRYLADVLIEARIAEGAIDAADLSSAGDDPARNTHRVQAMREVAERCCYGVDRNPMAVEMAKMSFWLVTMAQDRPFTYLDHNLQAGDSLLGITDLDQLRALHLNPAFGRARPVGLPGIDPASTWAEIAPLVDQAIELRRLVEEAASETARDTAYKAELTTQASRALAIANAIADLVVGCALSSSGNNVDKALDDQLRTNASALVDAIKLIGDDGEADLADLRRVSRRLLDAGRPDDAPSRSPLHWPLRFPEVFDEERRGFDAIVGNPPFIGGQKLTGAAGTDYRDHIISWLANGQKGSADLVAYFFLLAGQLGRSIGLLGTNTIAQGDTSEVGLGQLIDAGWTIHRAVSSTQWPGGESLEIAKVWLSRTIDLADGAVLDGRVAPAGIDRMLYPSARSGWEKQRLKENEGSAIVGSYVLGLGFTMTPEEAADLIAKDPRNEEVLFPYIVGEDLNQSPSHAASRWIINFADWDEDVARTYPDCFSIVEEKVKPDRLSKSPKTYPHATKHWWQYERPRTELYQLLGGLRRVAAISVVSKAVMPVLVTTGPVFAHRTVVFPFEDYATFGVLVSDFHRRWAIRYSSTLETRVNYSPSDCFATFPRPNRIQAVADAAERLDEFRSSYMTHQGLGLTDTYNRVHDSNCEESKIAALRLLHSDVDYAVRDAYGWSELLPDLQHGFHEVRGQGLRYTFSPDVADEVLELLLEENKRRYMSESSKKPVGKSATGSKDQTSLFEGED